METEAKSSWEALLPQFRSEYTGWSKDGEFYCPYCFYSAGKTGKGARPFLVADGHMKQHREGNK
jgi:hypothetical protein